MQPNHSQQDLELADNWLKPDLKQLPHNQWTPVGSFWLKLSLLSPPFSCQQNFYMHWNCHAQCRSKRLQAVRTTMNSWISLQVPHGWCLHLEGTAWSVYGATRWQFAILAIWTV